MLGCYRMKPATVANWSQSWEDGCNYTILLLFPSASLESNSGTLTIFPKFMYITKKEQPPLLALAIHIYIYMIASTNYTIPVTWASLSYHDGSVSQLTCRVTCRTHKKIRYARNYYSMFKQNLTSAIIAKTAT